MCNNPLFIAFNGVNLEVTGCLSKQHIEISVNDFLECDLEKLENKLLSQEKISDRTFCKEQNCNSSSISSLYLSLILVCNAYCYHCCAGKDNWSNDIPSYNQYNSLLEEDTKNRKKVLFQILNKYKNKGFSFSLDGGGEIFIYYNDIKDWLKTLNNKNKINFITNGSLLDENRIKELKQISIDTGVQYTFSVSVDGITKNTFEFLRKGLSFKETIKCIFTLKKYFYTEINVTIKKYNIPEIPHMEEFFKKLRVNKINYWYDWYDPSLQKYIS